MKIVFAIFLLVLMLFVFANFFFSLKRRDKLSKHINHIRDKHVLSEVNMYEHFPVSNGNKNCDVCFIKGGIIVFTIDSAYYFFLKEFKNEQIYRMASMCGSIQRLVIKEDNVLLVEMSLAKSGLNFLGSKNHLMFRKGNYPLQDLLMKYSLK